jgi:hypothetical protein
MATTRNELTGEARAWLSRTLLFEGVMEELRHGSAVITGPRIWKLTPRVPTPPAREPAAA